MKKSLAMLLTLALLCCAALTAAAETEAETEQATLVGVWTVDRMALDGENFTTLPEGAAMYYEFTEDGVMNMWATLNGETVMNSEGTYTVDGSVLTITVDGNEETDEFGFDGEELWVIESTGGAIIVLVPFTAEAE